MGSLLYMLAAAATLAAAAVCTVQLCVRCFFLLQHLLVEKDVPTGKEDVHANVHANKQSVYIYTLRSDKECTEVHAVRIGNYMLTSTMHTLTRKAITVLTCTC